MNCDSSGSAVPPAGTTATSCSSSSSCPMTSVTTVSSAGPLLSKGPNTAIMAPTVNQTPLPLSQGVITSTPTVTGATVTLVRPPTHTVQSGPTLNGNNDEKPLVVAKTTSQTGTQSFNSVARMIKEEPATTQAPQQQAVTSDAPRAAGSGGIQTFQQQILSPRLPLASTGQPSIHNIQLPPGMVLVRSESGQLLMIPQQALAQMQAQAQGCMAPRTATPTNMSPGQAPGNPIISRQTAPTTIIRQGCPTPTTLPATTTLHRPLSLQSSVGTAVPGITQRIQKAGNTVTSVTMSKETMENVNKCRNFLSTLIKLTCTGKRSTEAAASVKQLVKDLLENKLEAEEFTSRLYKELNSSPQPYLVPFLEKNLPALRQLTPDSAAFIQQSQLPQPASGPVLSTSPSPTTVVLSSHAPRLTAQVNRPQLQTNVSKSRQTPSLVLQPQHQRAMLRSQVPLAVSSTVNLRNQVPGRIVLGQPQVQLKELQQFPVTSEGSPVCRQSSAAVLALAQKNRLKEAGSTFKDDDDINDVASMAGVNLSEESANILATNSGLVGVVTHSCKDEAFISCALLQRRMLEIGRGFGVTDFSAEVINFVSHATQQRLRDLVERVSLVAQQKNCNFKEEDKHEQSSDVRAQLKFFEQLDQLEKQRKEEQEREILLKAAKSRARQEDPEQLRLKQKAKEMQQQELAQMRQREANLTALAAIGPRKKRKIPDSPSASAVAEGSCPSLSRAAGSSGSRLTRQRITRVNLRDLLFCLENERFTSNSHFLYKGFLK
ncbi:transcription initiation factor TFIID subunit 4-like isoform X1 [Dunckerocampus dactyliophorus]|uniref:transcription initiation factor TFIID subunit 4-like isoform X1 n=2 Tax=Dunckerocampus dactyliophorus TaxID=161453 RepID=UPI0024071D73|nr:transcription initiation factor TFIID subunit 4-like isoform X1 [Dunckerocampus dactyliophorus]XP_054639309.1 transcription initiation factor TFIID subunit 4-like isoform X1 [Dunckerocampus dactyliophorus]XP_054639310.1 transcription initiation factor TFIID subunit 4-like isoform X1 [Dunckerocampus dactyliophorus]XP_054639311.1 transcription initiation factor TFIID subunit 4-like isoform X1 [Dunckerocampus dactyliophorus]XP_054639312.1 transcription initiation factor TFIID subunit 4-like iso